MGLGKTTENAATINSVEYTKNTKDKEQITRATIGKGSISTGSTTGTLHRDTSKMQEITKDKSKNTEFYMSNKTLALVKNPTGELGKLYEKLKKIPEKIQKESENIPFAKDKNPFYGIVGTSMNFLSNVTGGLLPSRENHGGFIGNLPVLLGADDIYHTVTGNPDAKKVYANGIMNTEEAAKIGADELIGRDKEKAVWYNPTHGFIGDGLETVFDMFGNSIGYQTGISKQAQEYQANNKDKDFYLHSQAHAVFQEGASKTHKGHTYTSFGSPTGKSNTDNAFRDDNDFPPNIIPESRDPVSHPWPNVFIPWNYQYHFTDNYGRIYGTIKD